MVQPLLDLVNRTSFAVEFDVAKTYGHEKTKPTTTRLLSGFCEALEAMLTVHLALKLGATLGASTTKCEKSVFCSEN